MPIKISRKNGDFEKLFDNFLNSERQHCKNKCIFCFIDQLPKGLRDTLYYKDDDKRLSFLYGNYITLTNLSDSDVDNIIKLKISPINISVHTTDPALRVRMMKNKSAGEVLSYLRRFFDGGIEMNVQIVLCRNVNDGVHLKRTIEELSELFPLIRSIAVVPVGLTKFRAGLTPLVPFCNTSANEVIDLIEEYSDGFFTKYGRRMVYPADEFFILAGRKMREYGYYDEFLQFENGIGMMTLFRDEFCSSIKPISGERRLTIATGMLAKPFIEELVDLAKLNSGGLSCKVVGIKNNFFGESVTVSGLVTGVDLIEQLSSQIYGDTVLIPESMLRHERDLFLCGTSLEQVKERLGCNVVPVKVNGEELAGYLS